MFANSTIMSMTGTRSPSRFSRAARTLSCAAGTFIPPVSMEIGLTWKEEPPLPRAPRDYPLLNCLRCGSQAAAASFFWRLLTGKLVMMRMMPASSAYIPITRLMVQIPATG